MPGNLSELPVLPDQLPSEAEGFIDLDEASIAVVAGGLNPQPLPPGRTFRLN